LYKIIDNITILTGLTDNITALKTIILKNYDKQIALPSCSDIDAGSSGIGEWH
jgi:hypothetical protein